jgi:hypothetical protein
MPSSHKKVIVRKMDRDSMNGYLAPKFIVEGRLELLNTSGKVVYIELSDIKGVYFVRDFSDSETFTRKTFTTRPRTEGLWVRISFKDNEVIEGLMPNDLTQIAPEGFLVIPPDTRSNTQRIFIPRTALQELVVLGVIGGVPGKRRARPEAEQVPMFDE